MFAKKNKVGKSMQIVTLLILTFKLNRPELLFIFSTMGIPILYLAYW